MSPNPGWGDITHLRSGQEHDRSLPPVELQTGKKKGLPQPS